MADFPDQPRQGHGLDRFRHRAYCDADKFQNVDFIPSLNLVIDITNDLEFKSGPLTTSGFSRICQRTRLGTDSTHWRYGTRSNTWSVMWVAVSTMRRVAHDSFLRQNPTTPLDGDGG